MTIPYPFQIRSVEQIEEWDGIALLASEMGLGKTFMAYLYAKRNKHIRPIVIVCPASLKWNWEREAKIHCNMQAEVLEGRKPPRRRLLHPGNIFIINYDILPYWVKYLKTLKPKLV